MSTSGRALSAACVLLLGVSLFGQEPIRNGEDLPASVVARLGSFRLRHPGSLGTLAFAADGGRTIYAAGADKVIRQWSLDSGKKQRLFEQHTEEVRGLVATPDGKKLYSVSLDSTVQEWDLRTGKPNEFGKHDDGVEGVALSPNGNLLATSGRDHRIALWNTADGDRLCWLTGHENIVVCVAFSPDGKTLASASWDKTIRLWDAETHKPGHVLKGHTDWVEALAFSPDGKTLASGSKDGSIRLWDVATGKQERRFGARLDRTWTLAFTRDGKRLLAGGQPARAKAASLLAYDPASGKVVWERLAHTSSAKLAGGESLFLTALSGTACVILSPDGKSALTAGGDGRIRLWDPLTGRDLHPVHGHLDIVTGVVFQPSERLWLTAGLDGSLPLVGHERQRKEAHRHPSG